MENLPSFVQISIYVNKLQVTFFLVFSLLKFKFVVVFETRFLCVALAILELAL